MLRAHMKHNRLPDWGSWPSTYEFFVTLTVDARGNIREVDTMASYLAGTDARLVGFAHALITPPDDLWTTVRHTIVEAALDLPEQMRAFPHHADE